MPTSLNRFSDAMRYAAKTIGLAIIRTLVICTSAIATDAFAR